MYSSSDIDGSDSANKEKTRTKSEIDISCSVCNTDFSTREHYQRHLGTKKHKRNERSIRKEMPNGENSQLSSAYTFDKRWSYIGVREKYWQRKNRNYENNYTSYIWSVTAYWATSLMVNPAVKDFKISLNDAKWGDFGDAVIEINFTDISGKPSATKTFAIQFKQIVSNNFRTIESLGEGSFSVVNTVSKLASINCEEDLETVKFIMFTTASVSPALNIYSPISVDFCSSCCKLQHRCACVVRNKDLQVITTEVPVYVKPFNYKRKNIIDTSDDTQSIYHFFSSDQRYVLPKIYFYTSQKRPKHFPASIDDVFCEELDGGHRVQISRELTKYVENWCEGRCGGTYKLRKEDVLVKLGQLLLVKFAVTPKIHPMETQNNTFDVWLEAVNRVHVTVLKDSANLSEICVPMNRVIEKELGVQIDTTYEGVQVLRTKYLDVNKTANSVLRDYLFEELPRNYGDGNIQLETAYLTFWKAALIPMILHVDNRKNQEYVLEVINLLTGLGLHRKYFLKVHNIQIEKSYKKLSFFATLDDVIEKLPSSLLDRVKINVTDAYSMSLQDIRATDKLFQKSIDANEFFDMTMGKYVFKAHGNSLSKGRDTEELKLVLSGDHMEYLKQEIESKSDFGYLLKLEGILKGRCLRGLEPKLFG